MGPSAIKASPYRPGHTHAVTQRLPDLRLGDGAMDPAPADTILRVDDLKTWFGWVRGSRSRSTA